MSNRTDEELEQLEELLDYLKCELDCVSSDIEDNDDPYLAEELFDQKYVLCSRIREVDDLLKKEHIAYAKAKASLEFFLKEETRKYQQKEQREFRFMFWRDALIDPWTIPQMAKILPLAFTGKRRAEQLIVRRKVYQEFPHIYDPKIRFVSWEYAGPFRDLFITLSNGHQDRAKELFLSWIGQ
jgi:hypothetical protein